MTAVGNGSEAESDGVEGLLVRRHSWLAGEAIEEFAANGVALAG